MTARSGTDVIDNAPCFQLKAAMLAWTTIELTWFDKQQFERELQEKIRQAPSFFKDLPVVVALEKFQRPAHEIDFFQIIGICRRYSVQVVAVRGGDDDARRLARTAGLGCLPASNKDRGAALEPRDPEPAPPAQPEPVTSEAPPQPEQAAVPASTTRVITHPIRSGQQIYAQGGDLIILAQVSQGAEVLADGNIHVYGPLRGRALAGVKGDKNARIFCQQLEAELVSVAGQYKISEDLQTGTWKRPAQISLSGDKLVVEPLGLAT